MSSRRIITGLDIGTTKICTIIAEVTPNDQFEIIGIGFSPSKGLKKGVVVDIDKASNSIRESINKAQIMAGVEVDSAFIGIAGSHISSINNHGVVAVSGDKKEISENDIDRVMEAAQIISLPAEEEIIHVIPREFIVDGHKGIKDPLGMSGVRLEVETHIVKGSSTSIQNLVKSVIRAGIEVDDIVLEPLASSKSVLTDDEKELGVVLVDLGGGTTDIVVFHEGSIVATYVLPVGGNHVTHDIAIGLRTPISEAEKIKINYGSALPKEIEGEENYIDVLSASGEDKREIPLKLLINVIEPRTKEMYEMINRQIYSSGPKDLTPAGVVLTGGASLLDGSAKLAEDVFDLPVRLGKPDYVYGLSDVIDDPLYKNKDGKIPKAIFSTVIGLIEYGMENEPQEFKSSNNKNTKREKEITDSFFSKIKSWFQDFF
ncbi:MAG: cell division protein FtsA [Halanaerobiales bacterium]|nr:cell division protein FtsA [Halanaerobiales bacterium]